MIRLLIALLVVQVAAAMPATVQAQEPVGSSIVSEKWGKVWECTPNFKVMRDTKAPAGKAKSISISAARNEFEPFQLVITPEKQLKNVQVTARTLKGPGNAKIDAWNISVQNVQYINVAKPTDTSVSAGAYPDPLPAFAPFSAPKGMNSPVWVTVYVPSKTKPGDYSGVVDVTADGISKLSVPIKVHVWNFDLPTVSKLRTAYNCGYDDPARFQGATTLEQKRKLVELYNIDFWRHRVSPFNPYEFYNVKASVNNGKLNVDFTDFDIAIKNYFPYFNSFKFPDQQLQGTTDEDSDRLRIEYLRTVSEHLIDKGQLEKSYLYLFDEPTADQYKTVRNLAEPVRMADPQIKTLLTGQIDPALSGSVDIWVPSIDSFNENLAKARLAAGEEVWFYPGAGTKHPYPNYFIDYPAIDQRILPWIAWRYGLNGILYKQTTCWNTDPYSDPICYSQSGKDELGNGAGRLLYPPVRKPSDKFVAKGPVASIRWELVREGIEDYDYFYILKDRIAKAKSAGKHESSVKAAQDALKLVDSCAQSRTEYTRNPAELEAARAKVAEAIESLK